MSEHETQAEGKAAETPQNNQVEGEVSSQDEGQKTESAEVNNTPPTPEEQIKELEIRLAETHDQLLRKAAEFENFRKRINQEKANAIEYANQSLLLDIIPIIDNFERAITAGENSLQTNTSDYAGFLEGVKMIEKSFTSMLEAKWGLKRFNSSGELFDPNLHEAFIMEKSPSVSEATVQEDFEKGYMLKERVIRAARVKVLMPDA
jgi:molecular chaperone GrpE